MTELITTKEAISILGCTPGAFKCYIQRGNLSPDKKAKGRSYFKKERILNFSPMGTHIRNRPSFNRHTGSGLNNADLSDIVEKWRVNSRDSASADVQIGIYTEKIRQLEIEMKRISTTNPDFRNMRYTLLRHVGERRKLLHYLEISDYGRYRRAISFIDQAGRAA